MNVVLLALIGAAALGPTLGPFAHRSSAFSGTSWMNGASCRCEGAAGAEVSRSILTKFARPGLPPPT